MNDLRYGLRHSLRSPVFTAVAILTIALGVGANTAIFSFVNALLLRPLEGARDPAALAQMSQIRDGRVYDSVSYRDWLDYREQNGSFSGMAMYDGVTLSLNTGQEAERIEGAMVTGDYFETLGVKAALGRLITPDDARIEGASPVVALSHSLWRNRFGGDPLIVGKSISLNGFGYTIIGVAAEGFAGVVIGERADLWVPFTMWRQVEPRMAGESVFWKTDWFGDRGAAWMKAFGRLKPGVTIEQAQADLSTIAGRLARDYPQTNQKVGVKLASGLGLPEQTRDRVSQFVKLPMVIVGVVLLIVCANVAGMILARGEGRASEIGVRLALGARPLRIVRQLLKGRRFSAQDDQRSPLVAIINEALARRYWPNEDPLGKRFRFGANDPDNPLIEIVGVASDTKAANLFAPPRMYFYLPMAQHYQNQVVLHLRTSGQPERLVPAMRREIAALDRSLPVYEIKTLTRYRDDALTAERLAAYLISGFGVLAMALAAIGLYGRMSYDVERRAREIGIRMALGAQPRDTLRLIIRQGMTLALIGVAAGLIAAFATTRLIKGLLFGVSATDPLTFLMIAAVLIVTAGLACYIPAWQATKVDPIKSLRYE